MLALCVLLYGRDMIDLAGPPSRHAPIQEQRAYWRGLLSIDRTVLGADIIHTEARRNLDRLDREEAEGRPKL